MSEPNITRMDHGRTVGYWVRIYRNDDEGNRRCHSKMFSDGVWGSKRKALAAARSWRDKLLRKLRPAMNGSPKVEPGYGYVKLRTFQRVSGPHSMFVAWLRIHDGKCKSTSRSVAIWGMKGAKLECEKWLRKERRALNG